MPRDLQKIKGHIDATGSWIKSIALPLAENPDSGWQPYPLHRTETAMMDFFSCHVSVLSAGAIPHKPHKHIEEEILILLDGEAQLVIVDDDSPAERIEQIKPWSLVYYPAWSRHTIRNASDLPITYLMFKWRNEVSLNLINPVQTSIHRAKSYLQKNKDKRTGFTPSLVFEGPTRYLQKLHCHVSTLLPGAGYPPHPDSYDVAILLLSGQVETLGQEVGPYSVIFYRANEPHGIRNIGKTPAEYLVFEYHGADNTNIRKSLSRRIIRFPKRLIRKVLSIIHE